MKIQAETGLENKRIEAGNRALEVQNERKKREHELKMAEAGRIMREFEIFYRRNLNSLPESIKPDLIMQPNVRMKRSFTLLRGSEII